jgi:hypothetical protein
VNTQIGLAEPLLDNGCMRSPHLFLANTNLKMDPPSGVTVTVATSIEQGIQKNVVVVGQDPEEKGVGITVALDSVEGDIVHYEWQKTPCKRFSSDPGEPYTHCGTMKDYYWKDECVPVRTHEAYRKINDVKVWLEPSNETATWLGWGQNIPGHKATLRYIFPGEMDGGDVDGGRVYHHRDAGSIVEPTIL